jgi:ferredoxin
VKIIADLETCQGYANCVIEAPDIFDIDESTGKVVVLEASPHPGMEADARRAAAACPVKALTIDG